MTVEITEGAVETITRVHDYLDTLSSFYGEDHPRYVKAVLSWTSAQRSQWRLLHSGGKLTSEGNLSLGISAPNIYVGLIFFRDRTFDPYHVSDPAAPWLVMHLCLFHKEPMFADAKHCAKHAFQDFCLPKLVPVPGDWSPHS